METRTAVIALSALAHEGRLAIARLLIQAGPEGLAAGEIARRLGVPANTLSAQLNILSHAGLVTAERRGRSILYRTRIATVRELMLFLVKDCCGGRAELCQPLVDELLVCRAA